LEFLGDAVLELIVTQHLFTHYANPEGDLTNWRASLVNSQMLSTLATDWDLDDLLYLSRGEAKDRQSKARQQIWANAVEAIIGAIYLEKGYTIAQEFIHHKLIVKLPEILHNNLYIDAKSRFQETAQDKLNITPNYRVLKETGPDHAKIFEVGVYLNQELVSTGHGTSKHEAQTKAAQAALKIKNW